MKKNFFKSVVLLIAFFSVNALNAQEKGSSEIGVGYGIATSNEIINIYSDLLSYPSSLGNLTIDNENNTGAIYFNYNYAVINHLMIGGEFVYQQFTKDVKSKDKLLGEQTDNIYTIALTANYNYISKPNFRVYSGAGVAYSSINQKFDSKDAMVTKIDDDNYGEFNFNITGLGVRFGNKLAVQGELGFGYKGIFSAGLNYQF